MSDNTNMFRGFIFGSLYIILFVVVPTLSLGATFPEEPKISTHPIGSSFYRHLAYDYDMDLKTLVRFEKKGFGRSEMITLVLLHKITGYPLRDYGKIRLKNKEYLKDLAEEAGLDYVTLYKSVRVIKAGIEAKGNNNLPPPVYPDKSSKGKKKKKKKVKQ